MARAAPDHEGIVGYPDSVAVAPFLATGDEDMVKTMPLDAIVVLGCRADTLSTRSTAAWRRIERAAQAYREYGEPSVIVSGGKRWSGQSEAEAFAAELVRLGVPRERLLEERKSHSTRANARFSSELSRQLGFRRLGVVSCEWHLPRAIAAFELYGFDVESIPAAAPPEATRARRFSEPAQALWDRALIRLERMGLFVILVLCALVVACQRNSVTGVSTAPSASSSARVSEAPSETLKKIRSAEYTRRVDQLPSEALTSAWVDVRVAAMRALARSAGVDDSERLLAGLADGDSRVLGFAAFGLGRVGGARSAALVPSGALRAASLLAQTPPSKELSQSFGALALSFGRLGSDEAERSLQSWLGLEPELAEAAALGLGELAARRGKLSDETAVALLDAAEREPPLETALYAFARSASVDDSINQRLVAVATKALQRATPARAYAVRALQRAAAVPPLAAALADKALGAELRGELVRALANLGAPGLNALAAHLPTFPQEAAARAELVASPELGPWLALIEALPNEPNEGREALRALVNLEIPKPEWQARRAIALRCAAARLVAAGNVEHAALTGCDPNPAGRRGQLTRVAVLGRGKLNRARTEALLKLAAHDDALVRQAALLELQKHREATIPSELLVKALSDSAPGVVAAAADAIAHTESHKADISDEPLAAALLAALRAQEKAENIAATGPILDALVALGVMSATSELERLCTGPHPTLRTHAERALNKLSRQRKVCREPANAIQPPAELDHLVSAPVVIAFDTELGELQLTLDPVDAPLAVTRVRDLVGTGFYDGIEVHRFIPGFVLQFGDRGGDGYGGAGKPTLRSEHGLHAFGPRAIGLAESGDDSGAAQLFVTLGRFPHLDGSATYLGEAGPGWERLVAGDRILKARVVK